MSEGIRWVPLKRVAHVEMGQSPPSDLYNEEGEGLPFLQGNADFGEESPEPRVYCMSPRKCCGAGDVLLSVRAPVGARNVADQIYGIGRGLCAIHAEECHARFLWYATEILAQELQSAAVGSTYEAVSVEDVARGSIPLVPFTEQRVRATFLDRETAHIDSLISTKRRLVDRLEDRWSAVLWHVMTKGLDQSVEFKPSGLEWAGEIPTHWGTPPVYALFDVQLGKMLNPERAAGEHQAPYLRNINVQWDRFDLDDLGTMSFSPSDRIRYRLEPGDLLVCEGGEVGRSAIWNGELGECFYQKAIHRVRARGDDSTRFLMYALWCAALMDVFAVEGNRATIVHLTAEKLREHRLPMPPVDEQEEIMNYLDAERQRTIELQRSIDRQTELLRERRQALITAAVTGQIRVGDVA